LLSATIRNPSASNKSEPIRFSPCSTM
jgi:hypothetical protein